jgi:hypothetical protein
MSYDSTATPITYITSPPNPQAKLGAACPYSGKNRDARQRLRAAFASRLPASTSIVRDRVGKHCFQAELSPRRLGQMQPHERAAVINKHAIKLVAAEIRKGLHA